ncbi:DUF305 domain-containing protein [Streptomyces agglomeratus]|uniref:DUF305 domain-containing protein n=1 Tax=Streptomyces agglomeratus TaxID=285458 RepID=A0A1E5PEZ3_9ACTN|nr:DUF305 domain-containing protein [Streptomyces agglomeratus]OEJ28086.1 DUF305 domain-containing protein [Streptomyces agglomeratus]OEJ37851.1 DUF305 domain-containing protein [Streptomyces agglomeratus]OEJ47764.1 DUF305 domain-containing protein [Streptomyces agglomeratus]
MTAHSSPVRRAAALAATVTAAVLLAACGGGNDGGGNDGSSRHDGHGTTSAAPDGRGERNAADISFARGMIPHHRQAVDMAALAATRTGSAEVKKLAAEIKRAQGPEIRTLSGWLTAWGEKVPAGTGVGEHTGHSGSGMMTPGEMEKLEKSSGEAFDTAFLTMMVEHHEGAVEMARTERSDGVYGPAKDMAGDIVTSQSAEIARMNKLLGTG